MGGYRRGQEWYWSDGTPWRGGEPASGDENCTKMFHANDHRLDVDNCENSFNFFCQQGRENKCFP